MTSVLADTIPGIRVVKAFAQEQREIDRFRRANDHVLAADDRVNRTWSFFGPWSRCSPKAACWSSGFSASGRSCHGTGITVGVADGCSSPISAASTGAWNR